MVFSLAAKLLSLPSPSTRWISIWRASSRVDTPGQPSRIRNRVKFLTRAWARPGLTGMWLSRLVQPDISPLWALRPRLATKLQRPYISAEWGPNERCAALFGHYELIPRMLSPSALEAVYGPGLDVLELHNTTSNRRLLIRLFYQDQFEKEGELTLGIFDEATGLCLSGLTFCLARSAGRRVAIIGGLQANPDPHVRGLIHDVAKEMHGMRPKAFALWTLQQLCAVWHIEDLQGVCDAQHIYRHRHKRRNIAASYDEFWRECEGRQLPGGGWELPLQPRLRSREELKASRRKQHERRYALLGEVQGILLTTLLAYSPGNAAAHGTPRRLVCSFASKEIPAPVAPAATADDRLAGPAMPEPLNHSY